ncbi:MAG: CDP-glycerol glycerophosphotransferase family protein, partial [Rhizobiaceae bacterium]
MLGDVPPEFDEAFYLQTNPRIDLSKFPATYDHFLKWGYRDLRNPSPDFDLVWYAHNYGHEFSSRNENPFLHYLREGKSRGNLGHPPRPVSFQTGFSLPLPKSPRRACLFACYDPHQRIDEYVLIYLRELARHADVFFLADCKMPASELAKLEGIVKGAWAERHGAYDFGSYSKLARDLVGWDRLAEYNEVLFINDSCYLVHALDDMFASMSARHCAWWGLHAMKRVGSTRGTQPFPGNAPIPVSELHTRNYLDRFEYDPVYDFFLGSFFLAFRRDVVTDKRFQRAIDAVVQQKDKQSVIRRYEIGLTRFLIGLGYYFESWVPEITDRMPVYTEIAFDLIGNGYPLFKRLTITENPYKISSLAYWPTAIRQAKSLTSVEVIEANVRRLANADKLYENYNLPSEGMVAPAPYSRSEFEAYDRSSPKYDHYWGFPVCGLDHTLSGNGRAVFDAVKNDPRITKVIFTRSRVIEADGVNVITVPLGSLDGQVYLARCRHFFVRNGHVRDIDWPLVIKLHNVINLWHSVPLKRIGSASRDAPPDQSESTIDNSRLKAMISASDVGRLVMASVNWPLTLKDIWLTGLPRHDFITAREKDLPPFLTAQLASIRTLKAGRRMILFCPTSRNSQKPGTYEFRPDEVGRLAGWLESNGYVLGIREHPSDKNRRYSTQLQGESFIDVPDAVISDVEMLFREADMLITDYSTAFIDYMLTGRPAISFA